jgi:hemoglobin
VADQATTESAPAHESKADEKKHGRKRKRSWRRWGVVLLVLAGILIGARLAMPRFVRGYSREADQRAEQRIAKDKLLRGEADGGGAAKAAEKKSLYDRLGGEQGLRAIVDDFEQRVLADPRVNWERKGVKRGGFSLKRNKSVEWQATPENRETLKKHLVQFLSVATGGPATYEGREMKQVHANMNISNPEFDAAVGDLKATLDKIGVGTPEQKELLSIIESTRPQVTEER